MFYPPLSPASVVWTMNLAGPHRGFFFRCMVSQLHLLVHFLPGHLLHVDSGFLDVQNVAHDPATYQPLEVGVANRFSSFSSLYQNPVI